MLRLPVNYNITHIGQLSDFPGKKWPEVLGTIPRYLGLEYYFRSPSISGAFLPEMVSSPVGSRGRNHRPGNKTTKIVVSFSYFR
jgi:hypothetical protein